MFYKNKSQNFLLHPKKKFIYQERNLVKISGVCTTPDGYIPDQIFVKIGKREISCEHREGNQFWFQFKVGTGLKLIKVYSQYKDKKRILNWYKNTHIKNAKRSESGIVQGGDGGIMIKKSVRLLSTGIKLGKSLRSF